jgi:transcriptional regulator with GAF, ATPase, and Fis domain
MTPLALKEGSIDAELVADVFAEIADVASETLELQEVFDRVATSIRRIIPFDNMGVVRIVDDEHAVLHASTLPHKKAVEHAEPIPLTSWSPRWRPRPGPNPRIENAEVELDPSYRIDAKALQGGVRSGMWEPFASRDTLRGGVFLSAYRPEAFTDEHQRLMRPIAALLGSAVEHWRIWDGERRRRERLEQVEALLGTLAESLDVREVFETLSAELQGFLPHHLLNLTELSLKERTIRIVAFAGGCDIPIRTDPFPLSEHELENRMGFAIVDDIPAELEPENERNRLIRASGLRSWLHVPLWMSGEIKGSLSFMHREPRRYTRDDADIALLVAARVALTLSHQRLAGRTTCRTVAGAGRAVGSHGRDALARAGVPHPGPGGGQFAPVEGGTAPGRPRRVVRHHRAHHRRIRYGQGGDLQAGSSEIGASKQAVRRHQLRGAPRAVARVRAVRPREGRVHRRDRQPRWAGSSRPTEDAVPRRDRGDAPPLQPKLLRFLQERRYERVGEATSRSADVRLIAATNRDLSAAMARGALREDLYYRLNVFQIHLAPLRERVADILPLAELFLEDIGKTMARPAGAISKDAIDWLLAYRWPGNVRELRNTIERALLLCDGGLITRDHLPASVAPPGSRYGPGGMHADPAPTLANGPRPHRATSDDMNLGSVERGLVEKALADAKGNKSKAARLLGLTRAQLYSRLEKHGMR